MTLSDGQMLFAFLAGVGGTLLIAHSILEHDIKRWERTRQAMEVAARNAGRAGKLYDQDAPGEETMTAEEFGTRWRDIDFGDIDGGEERP